MQDFEQNTKVTEEEIKKLHEVLADTKKILIYGHTRIDPDGFSSSAVTAFILREVYNKEVTVYTDGPILKEYEKYEKKLDVELESRSPFEVDFSQYDLLLITDTNTTRRINKQHRLIDSEKFEKLAFIDHHHPKPIQKKAAVSIAKFTPSCAEIVYRVFEKEIKSFPASTQKDIANTLLYGLLIDSKIFSLPETNSDTLAVASELVRLGGEIRKTIIEYKERTYNQTLMLAEMLNRTKTHNLGFTYSYIYDIKYKDKDEKDKLIDRYKAELSVISDRDLHVVIQGKEKKAKGYFYQVRIRSRFVNVAKFSKFVDEGGGGHEGAGGFNIHAKNDEDILNLIAKKYKEFKELPE
jgi:nanoRNase/pAp phosphatase (c-di-AMP/oligoRNAs hydrolase)